MCDNYCIYNKIVFCVKINCLFYKKIIFSTGSEIGRKIRVGKSPVGKFGLENSGRKVLGRKVRATPG